MERSVLILTQQFDLVADRIVKELEARAVPVFRYDLCEFPEESTLEYRLDSQGGFTGSLRTPYRQIDLEHTRSVLYRRVSDLQPGTDVPFGARGFIHQEAHASFWGAFLSMPCVWVNHPASIAKAEYKPYQLRVAGACGLSIPPTLITNNPNSVISFAEEHGRIIYKTLRPLGTAIESIDAFSPVFTSEVDVNDLDQVDRVRRTSHLFQPLVDKKFELRITIVGDQVFPASISYGNGPVITDFRTAAEGDLQYDVYDLPDEVTTQLRQLMKRLDLNYGAVDMLVTDAGEHIFLEVNPGGEWTWMERLTGMPICAALVDLLAGPE
jgi:glutathione synthase/RimK-type ligase-like ATP-grasp enzyme